MNNREVGGGSFTIHESGSSSVDSVAIPLAGDFGVNVDKYSPMEDPSGHPIFVG